jgi:hypothetical protein
VPSSSPTFTVLCLDPPAVLGEAELLAAAEVGGDLGGVDDVLARQAGDVRAGPPTYLRSMTATFLPWEARVQARYLPASPLPSTTTSYSSAMDSVTFWKGRDGAAGRPGEGWAPRGRARKQAPGEERTEASRRSGNHRMATASAGRPAIRLSKAIP